ncbi:hypothetical protein SDC9_122614 [bioreactor metagenome]|uniref:Uncharacterized protein n=1 Tax=bioreactor metagenome TaxID=1076179 RepID=A0A645CFC1_9ZZZZ
MVGLDHHIRAEAQQNPLLNRGVGFYIDLARTFLFGQRQRQNQVFKMRTHADDDRIELFHVQFPDHVGIADVGHQRLGHLVADAHDRFAVAVHDHHMMTGGAELHRNLRPERSRSEYRVCSLHRHSSYPMIIRSSG